ncbi:MAG TPA: HNH endonuclease [Blastocatellia bacterium]|nr:HNH endonuclease [Blastocatellia bacterium]
MASIYSSIYSSESAGRSSSEAESQGDACALCERRVRRITKHHLIPKSEGGTRTVDLCLTCHKTLHSFFTNRALATQLRSIEALRRDPKVRKYLSWIRKQPDRSIRVRVSRDRR